ncbi:hypothetical protein D3C78_1577980 [compost metagenome]
MHALAGAALAGNDLVRAVPAGVVEGADAAVGKARHGHPLAEELEGDVVARVGDLADVAGDVPGAREDCLLLQLEEAFVVVDPAGQGVVVAVIDLRAGRDGLVHVRFPSCYRLHMAPVAKGRTDQTAI